MLRELPGVESPRLSITRWFIQLHDSMLEVDVDERIMRGVRRPFD